MRPQYKKLATALAAVLALTVAQAANAIILNDNYTGSNYAGDVLGNGANYNIHSMNLTLLAGDILSVTINTNFAGKSGSLLKNNTVGGTGIGYGDIFLTSSWTPVGVAPYLNDSNVAAGATKWTYGFSLDNRYSNVGGAGTLYSLNSASAVGDVNPDALLSDDFMSANASFRHGQEVAVDTASAGVSVVAPAVAGNNSWSVGAGSINFLIDLSGTNLVNANGWGLHWGMTCANDVIEGGGGVSIRRLPEPAVLGMLALGLIGIGLSKRRKA